MKAKDTVMKNLALLGSNSQHNKEVERLIKQARNEGYKAGIKEVVEWINNNNDNKFISNYILCRIELWQSKLKEWGIND